MSPAPVLHPLGIEILRTYLLQRTEVTALVTDPGHIADTMPPEADDPRWPAIRLNELATTVVVPRVWTRMLVTADCWDVDQPAADRLGRVVLAALQECANTTVAGAVLGEPQDLTVRAQPDGTVTPAQPRSIVTAHIWIRPS